MESFTSAVQTLIKTNEDFRHELELRLVFESSNVKNPFKFIVGLLNEHVLSDGSSDSEAMSFGLEEMMAQLAMRTVCSKGAEAIGGLTKALEESGNLHVISALRTWIKEDFAIETEGDKSEARGAAAAQTGTSENLTKKHEKSPTESESNAAKLIDMILSRVEDAKMLVEKWAVRFGEPVDSLQIAQSTLVVATRHVDESRLWWVDISRSDMRLQNPRLVVTVPENTDFGFLVDNDNSFVYYSNVLLVRYTKSGEIQENYWGHKCWLEAPTDINALTVVDPAGCNSFVVAGCKNGVIATWDTRARFPSRKPDRTFQGQQDAIVGLNSMNGHLLSVCEGGKLLMWSVHDLQNEHVPPIPRVLAEDFHNVTSLVACERWFASTSSKDRTINIWTLPNLWLRPG